MADRNAYLPGLPGNPQLPSLYNQTLLQLPRLPQTNYRPYKPFVPYHQEHQVLDYNDPYEINSLADIIMATLNPLSTQKTTSWGDYFTEKFGVEIPEPLANVGETILGYVLPHGKTYPTIAKYIENAYVKPIAKGAWQAAGINALTNFQEVMDLAANPVKGFVLNKEDRLKGVADALGIGGEGRKNYNYDTGNLAADIGRELVSDPLNWFTLFTKAGLTALAKGSFKTVFKNIKATTAFKNLATGRMMEDTAPEVSEKYLKQLASRVAAEILSGSKEAPQDIAARIAEKMATRTFDAAPFTTDFVKQLKNISLDAMTVEVLRGASKVIEPTEFLEKTLFKAAIGVPYATAVAAKAVGDDVYTYLHNRLNNRLNRFRTPSGNLDILQYEGMMHDIQSFKYTFKEIIKLKDVIPDEKVYHELLRETFLREQAALRHYVYADLKKVPNINKAEKAAKFRKYVEENMGEEFLETLQDMAVKASKDDPTLVQLYRWVRRYADADYAARLEQRQAVWDKYKLIKDYMFQISKSMPPQEKNNAVREFLEKTYGQTLADFLKELEDVRIKMDAEFQTEFDGMLQYMTEQEQWLIKAENMKPYTAKEKSAAVNPIYEKKRKIEKDVREIFKAPIELEGSSRFELLDNYIRAEYNHSLEEHITALKELIVKYDNIPGVVKHLEFFENALARIKQIDESVKRYVAMKQQREQIKIIRESADQIQQVLLQFHGDIEVSFNGFIKYLHGLDLTKKPYSIMNKYTFFELIRDVSNRIFEGYVVRDNPVPGLLTSLRNPDLMKNPAYKAALDEIEKIVAAARESIEKQIARQLDKGRQDIFINPDSVKKYIKNLQDFVMKSVDEFDKAQEAVTAVDKLNNLGTFETALTKNANKFRELLENLLNFATHTDAEGNKDLAHLAKYLIKLEHKATPNIEAIAKFKHNLYREIRVFFKIKKGPNLKDITDVVATQRAQPKAQKIYTENGVVVETPQTLLGVSEATTISDLIKDWAKQNKGTVEIRPGFIDAFEMLETALAYEDIEALVKAAEQISKQLYQMSRYSPRAEELVKPLLNYFDKYHLADYTPITFDLTAGRILYRLKLEQDYVHMMVMTDKGITEYIQNLLDPQSPIGNRFKNLVALKDPDAQALMDSLTAYVNYVNFIDDLYKYVGVKTEAHAGVEDNVLTAFRSTIQKYARREPQALLDNFDNNFYHVMEDTESQLNSMMQARDNRLDTLVEKLLKQKDYANKAELSLLDKHRANADAKRTYYVVKEFLPSAFKEDEVVIHMDIETTGLESGLHEITELGMYSDKIPDFDIDLRAPSRIKPSEAFLSKQTGADFHNTKNELELLQKFIQALEPYAGQKITINMHNGFQFDKPFILNRLEHYFYTTKDPAVKEFAAKARTMLLSSDFTFTDSLKLMREQQGWKTISDVDRTALYYSFRNFTETQKDQTKLIQPIDPELAKQLANIGKKLMLDGEQAAEYQPFFDRAHDIYLFFQSMADANRGYGQFLLEKTVFEDELFQKLFGHNITQALSSIDGEIVAGTKQYAVRKAMDADLILEFFNRTNLTDYEMDYYTRLARNIDQAYKALRHSNRLKHQMKNINATLERFIKLAQNNPDVPNAFKYLKVTDDHLKNFAMLRALIKYKSTAFKGYGNVLEGLLQDTIPRDVETYLKRFNLVKSRVYVRDAELDKAVDVEFEARRVARQERYEAERTARELEKEAQEETKKDKYLAYWLRRIAEIERREGKEAAQKFRDKGFEHFQKGLVDAFLDKLKAEDPDLLNFRAYHDTVTRVVQDGQDIQTMLDELGKGWDKAEAHRAVVQVRGTVLRPMFEFLDAVRIRHAQFTNSYQHFTQIMKYRDIPDVLYRAQMQMITEMSDEMLFQHLVNDARGLIILDVKQLSEEKLKMYKAMQGEGLGKRKYNVLVKDNAVYFTIDPKIKVSSHVDDTGYWVNTADGVEVPPPMLPNLDYEHVIKLVLFEDEDKAIAEKLIDIYKKLFTLNGDFDTLYSPHTGSAGEMTSKEFYTQVYDSLPNEVKHQLPHARAMYRDILFHGSSFNHSVIGDAEFRRSFYSYGHKDIVSMMQKTMTMQSQHLKAKVEYMNMFFDKSLGIDVGPLQNISNEQLLQALKNSPEYRLVALVKDAKQGAKVVDINPQTVDDVSKARFLDATIMSYQTFSKAFGVINSWQFTEKGLHLWQKINYLYKAGYLMTPGALMRNLIDSVMKNYISANDDPTGMTQAFQSALTMYPKYKETFREILAFSNGRITDKSVQEYFATGVSPLSKDQYDFIHGFFMDGPSGGQIAEVERYFTKDVDFGAWSTVVHGLSWVMKPTKGIEQLARLAEYMWAIEKGYTTTKAYQIIAKTHFDYTIKTDTQRLLELIFPFYTFTVNNLHYWVDAMENIPWLGVLLNDIYTPIWNLDSYDTEEINHNRSLQYQILSGNLLLNDEGMTLKLNPSFMDVFSLVTDPLNTIKSKLAPYFQTGLDAAGQGMPIEMKNAIGIPYASQTPQQAIIDLLPIAGPIFNRLFEQGPKYYERTGNVLNSILPSVFGATADYQPRALLQRQQQTYQKKKFNYIARPRTPRRAYPKRFYARMQRYYPKYPRNYNTVSYYAENFYNKLYRKSGKSRLKAMSVPVTGQTLMYRLRDLHHYYK